MRSRLFLLVVAVALVAAGWFFVDRRVASRNRATLLQTRALTSQLEACVAGNGPLPRDAPALTARLRRIALAPETPATWPARCASRARALADLARGVAPSTPALAEFSRRADALAASLTRPAAVSSLRAFRAGSGDGRLAEQADALRSLQVSAGVLAAAYGTTVPMPSLAGAPAPLRPVGGDVIPVAVAPGAVVAGWNHAAGTLTALFIEPTRERVFCRSRDRGASMGCRRYSPEHQPHYLIGNDEAEALVLIDGSTPVAGQRPLAAFASADAPEQPLFTLGLPIVSSLPARVSGSLLLAVADDQGSAVLLRCQRGGACARSPAGLPSLREDAVVSAGAELWWLGVAGEAGALSLDARRLSNDPSAPPGEVVHITPLQSTASLLTSCHAQGVTYVGVVDSPGTHLIAIEPGHAPRSLGEMAQGNLPFDVSCDEQGATLSGSTSVQSCARSGGCSPMLTVEGYRRFARVGGELVMVSLAPDGEGIRVRHGDPARIADVPGFALDDDAAHGGLSARALWLFSTGDRLVLFATGATTAVLWSDDRGARWHPASEAFEGTVHPMRIGTPRP